MKGSIRSPQPTETWSNNTYSFSAAIKNHRGITVILNNLKILFGHIIIGLIHYPWRITEKVTGKSLKASTKAHYYIMMIFRSFFSTYPVVIRYPNPVKEDSMITLKVNLCQNNQQWFFRLKQRYEREWITLVYEGMKYADAFIDIGANIGVYTMTIANALPDKEVIAVEPLKDNFETLNENSGLNNLLNVRTHKAVVTNSHENTISFYPNPIHDGGGSTIKADQYRTGDVLIDVGQYQRTNTAFVPEIKISNVRVDDLVHSRSVLKIDVEGAEIPVLESGRKSLEDGKVDLVIVEVLDETIGGVISFLNELEFDCFAEGANGLLSEGAQLPHFVGNILGLRRQAPQYESLRSKFLGGNERYGV